MDHSATNPAAAIESLAYVVNHVFLPPKTPQEDDTTIAKEHRLINSLLESVKAFSDCLAPPGAKNLGPVVRMLQRLLKVKPGMESNTKNADMKQAVLELEHNEYALFHIRAQNAGLLITSRQGGLLVESFELLAPNKDVMSCPGRLVREFPDNAAEVDRAVSLNSQFLDELTSMLCQLELQESALARPKSTKSGQAFDEERDTNSPFLVTDMVMGILTGLGRSVEPQRIFKRSREQVNWNSARLPFHRSPTWLLLRTALRLVLDRGSYKNGHVLYKALMAFHHGRLLDQAVRLGLDREVRFVMGAKVARRVVKLGTDTQQHPPWLQKIMDVIKANHDELQRNWQLVQGAHATSQADQLEQLCFQTDANLRLQTLNQHISWIRRRSAGSRRAIGPGDTTSFSSLPAGKLPTLLSPSSSLASFALLELELWIESNLSAWTAERLQANSGGDGHSAEGDLLSLQQLMTDYHTQASNAYEGSPEALSVVFLNIMDLWVALDKIAGAAVPLLLEYDPGFTPDFLHPLVLPTKVHMARLQTIERYLHRREEAARNGYPQAFAGFGRRESFAVRYFDSSPEHKSLLEKIQAYSERMSADKIQQCRHMRRRHAELSRELAASPHDQVWDEDLERDKCVPGCKACRLKGQMSALKIRVFEQPLPADLTVSKAITFEISVPQVVVVWRDVITRLFLNVLRDGKHVHNGGRLWHATDHSGLSSFRTRWSRLHLASRVKPVEASHYRDNHITHVTETGLIVRHSWSNYDYYEENTMATSTDIFQQVGIPTCSAQCSFAVFQAPPLRSWTRSTGHTSNGVIACQPECPQGMSLDAFRAFGHLRSGLRLQWANVLLQLKMPSLDWTQKSTYYLILQACLEAGPPSSDNLVHRETHMDILDDDFVRAMTAALTHGLGRFRANWQNDIAVSLLACLATRVLSLTTAPPLVDALLGFLSEVRRVTLKWARQLLDRIAGCQSEAERTSLNQRVLVVALACMSTFDIESGLLKSLLHLAPELSAFIEAAILAQDHFPTTGIVSDPVLNFLSHRWRRAMHRTQGLVKAEVVAQNNPGFHQALRRFWADYSPSAAKWSASSDRSSHILTAEMAEKEAAPTKISFNLLEGRLLVNGYPLARLPREYESHSTYGEVFGTQALEVMPSTRPGMQFSACREQHGWVVHFALVERELVIQAVRQRDAVSAHEVCEFIPSQKLTGDVPNSFVRNYSHWLNASSGAIEFRPADRPWTSSPDNWVLTQKDGQNILSRDGCFLIDPHSATANTLSAILSPIESAFNIDIVFVQSNRALVLDLPRFSLSFTLTEGESVIRSKHYAGMCIDHFQGIGTLVGLKNKLVLRQQGVSTPCTPLRMVLVPRGILSSQVVSGHVSVSVDISPSASIRVKHDAFTIDSTLGQLTSRGSLSSKLYLCHLHAVASHYLPDALTGRTGTEEALRILGSASIRSFQRLDTESRSLLLGLANISPQRVFYPKHLQNMEQVTWSDKLPILSQHDAFWQTVDSILEHARDCEVLYPSDRAGNKPFELDTSNRSPLLVDRAKIRNATFQVSEFGAEDHMPDSKSDRRYQTRSRKKGQPSKNFARSRMVSKCVISSCPRLMNRLSGLRGAILRITGTMFSGRPRVNITFRLDHLGQHQTALAGLWCGLHLSLASEPNRYRTAFFLSALVHAEQSSWDVVQALVAIANSPDGFWTTVTLPAEERFDLTYKIASMRTTVNTIVESHSHPLERCPEAKLGKRPLETKRELHQRRYQTWKSCSGEMARSFVSALAVQWSQGWTVSTPTDQRYGMYMDVNAIMQEVRTALDLARRTSLFEKYLADLENQLDTMDLCNTEEPAQDACGSTNLGPPPSRLGFVTANALFSRPAPSTSRPQAMSFAHLCNQTVDTAGGGNALGGLFDQLSQVSDRKPYEAVYIDRLRSSSCSTTSSRSCLREGLTGLEAAFEEHLLECKRAADEIRSSIDCALGSTSTTQATCQAVGFYPRISPVFLLQRLNRSFWSELEADWRECLVNYGLSLAYAQRAERLVYASRRADKQTDLLKELANMGSHGCYEGDPLAFPENLILELEQNILIRPVQQEIASKMREPPEGSNCVMQLNMGEGKSSVIVPIVSTALADGKRLVRVVVAKPQSKQMMHTLVGTLGGLIHRRVFYLPISRATRLTSSGLQVVRRMLETCRESGGVLLVQPEHLLSFKLMGLERSSADHTEADGIGKHILKTYREFEDVSRDIVDESDENFSVKFELVYTMGTQRPIDMSPDRWLIIQELMDIVREVAGGLSTTAGAGPVKGLMFEENKASGQFPTIRVLEESAGKRLIDTVAEHVCRTGLRGFQIHYQSKKMRQAVLKYILHQDLDPGEISTVENAHSGFFSEPATRHALLLLRGLLASNVILFALGQKRFRVNYGLAPDRRPPTMLAVPYRAKDSPAPRSEFSHPDVVIVLTCLSYYYQGLSNSALRTCLETLNKSDQAEQEYSRWAAASPQLPSSLRHFSGVNLKDYELCKRSVFPALRHAKPAVDFYLANIVFPKEMREFPLKLSASGWDLGKMKRYPLTGFSGTIDSKDVLPLSVTALDLPEQRHTNSAVLLCLLRDENTVLELGGDQDRLSALTVDMLLAAVTTSTQSIRVILDVGAQIIELDNLEVARRWLGLVPSQDADAIIFFNEQDELSVLARDSTVDSFLSSPFATQTDRCLVFLDQAHTRGTDLKLPDSYRAAVTLGPGVTKDTLVQACMRMRKLGAGQSVTFCVSPEMQKRIRSLGNVDDSRRLTTTDVLVCAIAETWDDARRSVPLWATQGIRHQHQEAVWNRVDKSGTLSVQNIRDYLEDEAQSLEQRYRPASRANEAAKGQSISSKLIAAEQLECRQAEVGQIKAKCTEFGLANLDAMGNLQEEQERELAPEVERERQVERPAAQKPADHSLHADVRAFAVSGVLKRKSPAFLPAFQSLAATSGGKLFPVATFPSSLLVTADFARAIRNQIGINDAFHRPVQWLLTQATPSTKTTQHMVIVSAWEANLLKPLLQPTTQPPVYLRGYLPRTSLSFPTLEDLATYTIPRTPAPAPAPDPDLVAQLNLFAGQVYLRSHADYARLCRYLGLAFVENEGEKDIAADGFVGKDGGAGYEACGFGSSPVGFLGALVKTVRRDCLDVGGTHVGRLLAGEILRGTDFEGEIH